MCVLNINTSQFVYSVQHVLYFHQVYDQMGHTYIHNEFVNQNSTEYSLLKTTCLCYLFSCQSGKEYCI